MSIDTTKAMNYSWMSQASYLDLTAVIPGSATSLQGYLRLKGLNEDKIFSDQQAKAFTDATTGYSFISQLPNTGNGTSATVFKSNTDGSYTIAVRGTEPDAQIGKDLLQDLFGVVEAGKAKVQLLDAFRYYKQITTDVGKEIVYSEAEKAAIGNLLLSGTILTGPLENLTAAKNAFVMLTANDKGLGKLIPDGATINFAGHSLGGHVAYLLADLVSLTSGGSHPLGDVMTYNAPGENFYLYEWQNWLGRDTSEHSGLIGSKHLAYYGKGGLNVTAGLGQVIGTRVPLFIEDEGTVNGSIAMANHSIVKLSDSLALYDTYSNLSPALTQDTITGILKGASNEALESLESALDTLRTLLLDGDIASNTSKQTPTENRDAFYKNLYELQDSANYKTLKGSASIIPSGSGLGDQAKSDFGSFLALNYLLPFTIGGAVGTLSSVHNTLYAAWQADQALTPAQKSTGAANFSDQWYADRAQFLASIIQANLADTGDGKNLRADTGGIPTYFEDKASGLALQTLNSGSGQGTNGPNIRFGGTGNDIFNGSSDVDHLYGGAGSDTLNGGAGDDYLEGNAGADNLTGGAGNDTLVGGSGFDTYTLDDGTGWDTLDDSDGQGAVYYGSQQLTGGEAVGDSGRVWQQQAGGKTTTYILTDWTENGQTTKRLSIQGPDGGVFIRDWRPDKNLGIALPGAPTAAPPTVTTPTTLVGGASASYLDAWGSHSNFTDPNQSGPILYPNMQAGAGNAYIDGNHATNIKGGAGNAWIVGRAPDNTVSSGPQTIQGGRGDTLISTGAAAGTFIGGAGNTLIDARYYRSFQSDYAWNAIGSAFKLDFGWQASDAYRTHVAYDLGYFDPGQTPDTGGLDWLGYVDTAELSDGDRIYVAQPSFGSAVIDGQDPQGKTYRFDPQTWTLTLNGSNPVAIREWIVPITDPKKQTLIGGQGDSVLLANDAGNTLIGGGGMNVLIGGRGNDRITAGGKNDLIDGGAGDDVIAGGAGDSRITGGAGNNTIEGGSGNETIYAGDNVTDWASAGADTANRVAGNGGNDNLIGSGGVDTLLGGSGNDSIWGGNANDLLDGGADDDYLDGGDNDDRIDGGNGNDLLFGGQGQDLLQGGVGDDELQGEAGNDTLAGGSGSNRLFGGAGDDRYLIDGGSVNAIADTEGNDTLVFGAGIDLTSVVTSQSASGNQLVIDYGTGQTTIDNGFAGGIERFQTANGSTMNLSAFLAATLNTPVTVPGHTDGVPNTVYGGTGADRLTGGSGARLIGGRGNDTLSMTGAEATFDFRQGDGQDTVLGTSGVKHFSFAEDAGILAGSVRLAKAAPGMRDLLLTYGGAGDSVYIEDSAYSIDQTYRFADGTVLTHRQLLEQSGIGLDWLGNATNEAASGTSNADRLLGAGGNDALDGLDGNDWLAGGDGRDTLAGGNGDDVLVGGAGDDTLAGGAGDDTLIGGAGTNRLDGGAGHDVYVLEHGAYNEIVDRESAGDETIRLPDDMRLADFYAARLDDDLIMQSLSGDTTAKIVGFFAKAVEGKSWVVSCELEAAKSLREWVTEQLGASGAPGQTGGESQRAGFAAALRADLAQQGALGKTIGDGTDFSSLSPMSMYFDQNLRRYLPFEYSFGGVVTKSISMTGEPLTLGSSESDSVVLSKTAKTVEERTPIYETWTSLGPSYVITPPTGASFGYPHGSHVTSLGNGSFRIEEPGYWHSAVVGENVVYRDILANTDLVTRTFTIANVQGTEGDDTVNMRWPQSSNVFRGTVVTGDGNDNVDLGTSSKSNNDWFSGADWGPSKSYGLGAYIDSGNGDDRLIGTDANDVLVAGSGNDFLDGGLGTDTYHVSLESGAQDVVYDSGNPGWNAFAATVYGGQLPLDVLVFDAGITVQNLFWRLIENSIYDGHHALEIFGGKGKIVVVFDDAADPAETESAIGVERFRFADGTVLTRAEFMAQATEVAAAPVLGSLADASVAENATLNYLIPEATSASASGGDSLSYEVQSANGDPLPVWLTFDPVTRTLSGAPGIGNLAQIALQVRAVNAVGEFSASSFVLSVIAAPGQSLLGTHAADTLVGMSGDDTIDGGTGADTLIGGLGNDTYRVDRATDQVVEAENSGTDTVIASSNYTLPDNVENLTLSGSAEINGHGNGLDNVLIGNAGNNRLFGENGNDTLYGNTGMDQLSGGDGDDSILGDPGDDELKGGAGNDWMDGGEGADLIYGASGDDTATGGSGNDYLLGGNGQDSLDGGLGNDILDGTNGADTLNDLNGNNGMLGGANSDTLTSGAGNDLLVGGSGNDTIVGQGGQDVILFNQGDGYDRVTLGAGTNATVSLGGGIAYGDLTLKKSGADLILGTGNGEGIVFKAWYSSAQTRNVQNLQVIAEAMAAFDANGASPLLANKVQEFDFNALVNEFDRVRTGTKGLSTWAISDALTQFHLSGSDSLALGGDLAYQYGKNGSLAGINLSAAQSVIDDPAFGVQAQALKPLAGLQGAAVTL